MIEVDTNYLYRKERLFVVPVKGRLSLHSCKGLCPSEGRPFLCEKNMRDLFPYRRRYGYKGTRPISEWGWAEFLIYGSMVLFVVIHEFLAGRL